MLWGNKPASSESKSPNSNRSPLLPFSWNCDLFGLRSGRLLLVIIRWDWIDSVYLMQFLLCQLSVRSTKLEEHGLQRGPEPAANESLAISFLRRNDEIIFICDVVLFLSCWFLEIFQLLRLLTIAFCLYSIYAVAPIRMEYMLSVCKEFFGNKLKIFTFSAVRFAFVYCPFVTSISPCGTQAVIKQFSGSGYESSDVMVIDEIEMQRHQQLDKLYKSTRAGRVEMLELSISLLLFTFVWCCWFFLIRSIILSLVLQVRMTYYTVAS